MIHNINYEHINVSTYQCINISTAVLAVPVIPAVPAAALLSWPVAAFHAQPSHGGPWALQGPQWQSAWWHSLFSSIWHHAHQRKDPSTIETAARGEERSLCTAKGCCGAPVWGISNRWHLRGFPGGTASKLALGCSLLPLVYQTVPLELCTALGMSRFSTRPKAGARARMGASVPAAGKAEPSRAPVLLPNAPRLGSSSCTASPSARHPQRVTRRGHSQTQRLCQHHLYWNLALTAAPRGKGLSQDRRAVSVFFK